jgi:membrane-bound metal-dependent hydrolase YbcI (DUF457 family)
MQTQTHFLLTAALGQLGRRRARLSPHMPALLVGSVLPDVPLVLLTLLYDAYYRWVAPPAQGKDVHAMLHFSLFYTDPVWIIGHNTLHSLVVTGLLALAGALLGRRGHRWGWMLCWFALAAAFHTSIDIFTHHSDGPLFLFPLSWTYRFASPLSYWEDAYYANAVRMVEYLLSVSSLIYLARTWVAARRLRAVQPDRHQDS